MNASGPPGDAQADAQADGPARPRRAWRWGVAAVVVALLATAGTVVATRTDRGTDPLTHWATGSDGAGTARPRSSAPAQDAPARAVGARRTDCPSDDELLGAAHDRPSTDGTSPWIGLKQCWAGWDTAVLATSADLGAEAELVVFRDSGGRLTEVTALPSAAEEGLEGVQCDVLRRLRPPQELFAYACEGEADPGPFDEDAALAALAHSGYAPLAPMKDEAGPLRAVPAIVNGGRVFRVFLFHGNRFLGTLPVRDVSKVTRTAGPSVTVRRDIHLPDDAECCPSGGTVTHRITWNGLRLVADPPLPS